MSSNPRRTPVTRLDSNSLSLKTSALKKGATFHSPTSPTATVEAVFRPPSLPRRSQSNLDDVLDSHRRRAALTISEIDKQLAGLSLNQSPRKVLRDDSLPIPRGVLDHTLDAVMAKEQEVQRRILRPRTRRTSRNHESDSGLGTSIASTNDEKTAALKKETTAKTTAVTKSVASRTTTTAAAPVSLPGLSARATNRICEHTLKPILSKPAFKDFHPLLLECPRKIQQKEILCLRDLEKTLLLVAPVSDLTNGYISESETYQVWFLKERTKSTGLYLDFCLTTIRCIQATVQYLGERELTRPRDVPYSNGYFIDLVDQMRQYAQQLAEAKEKGDKDEMDVDPYALQLQPARSLDLLTFALVLTRSSSTAVSP